jgi:hypothetical protein
VCLGPTSCTYPPDRPAASEERRRPESEKRPPLVHELVKLPANDAVSRLRVRCWWEARGERPAPSFGVKSAPQSAPERGGLSTWQAF